MCLHKVWPSGGEGIKNEQEEEPQDRALGNAGGDHEGFGTMGVDYIVQIFL